MLHGRQIKRGRSKPMATSIPIKRSNDQRNYLHGTNPMQKCHMNTDTSATDTIQEEYSIQNLKQDMKQDEPIDVPNYDA